MNLSFSDSHGGRGQMEDGGGQNRGCYKAMHFGLIFLYDQCGYLCESCETVDFYNLRTVSYNLGRESRRIVDCDDL